MSRKTVPPTRYFGFDPGAAGGLAWVDSTGEAAAVKMPPTRGDVVEWLRDNCPPGYAAFYAMVEKVGGFIGGGDGENRRNVASASAMFSFGASYERLCMAVFTSRSPPIPLEEPIPTAWQKGLKIAPRRKVEKKEQWKNRLKGVAQQLFPALKVTLNTADALLIAEYCRRSREGKL